MRERGSEGRERRDDLSRGRRVMNIDARGFPGRGAILVLVCALAACGETAQADPQAAGEADDESLTRVVNVEVVPLERDTFTDVIRLTGTVAANRDVMISAEESGVIRELFVEKGSQVEAGRWIAKIDDRVLKAQVSQARAQAELASETWERRKRLWEEDGVGSEIAYLEARYAAEQAQASLEALEERLDRTVIRAPIGGTLDERPVEVGSMVTVGTAVARIVELDPVKITGGVPERFAPDVRPGAPATVTFDIFPGEEFRGEISYVGEPQEPDVSGGVHPPQSRAGGEAGDGGPDRDPTGASGRRHRGSPGGAGPGGGGPGRLRGRGAGRP